MEWAEVNLDAAVWAIPAHKMKTNKKHKVALSEAAVELLRRYQVPTVNAKQGPTPKYVFGDGRLNQTTLQRGLMKDTGADVHGFRTCFAEFVGERTEFDYELADRALSHSVGSRSRRAYDRSDRLDRRRPMMAAWATFVMGG